MIVQVDDLERPELAPYRTLRRQQSHWDRGIFVAEGDKVVRRLLASGVRTLSMLCTPEWLRQLIDFNADRSEAARCARIPIIYVAAKEVISRIIGYRIHQGLMAVGSIPPAKSLDDTVVECARPRLLVALDGVAHAENVGLILRNSAAFGVQAAIVGETACSPYLRRAVRNSMGAVFALRVVHVKKLAAALAGLRAGHGVRIVVANPRTRRTLAASNLDGDICIVFGSEGDGVSAAVAELADEELAIPMRSGVDSLNVASASAVFLYEATRSAVFAPELASNQKKNPPPDHPEGAP